MFTDCFFTSYQKSGLSKLWRVHLIRFQLLKLFLRVTQRRQETLVTSLGLFILVDEEVGNGRQDGDHRSDQQGLGRKVGDHVTGNRQCERGNEVFSGQLEAVVRKFISVFELDHG